VSQTITISDNLYTRLQTEAQRRGFSRVEDLLELWTGNEHTDQQRRETVREIRAFRERMQMKYGAADDSVDLLRADRMR
jgi:predicted CopG family antitoxin